MVEHEHAELTRPIRATTPDFIADEHLGVRWRLVVCMSGASRCMRAQHQPQRCPCKK